MRSALALMGLGGVIAALRPDGVRYVPPPVTREEDPVLVERRRQAIAQLGQRWLLHDEVRRRA